MSDEPTVDPHGWPWQPKPLPPEPKPPEPTAPLPPPLEELPPEPPVEELPPDPEPPVVLDPEPPDPAAPPAPDPYAHPGIGLYGKAISAGVVTGLSAYVAAQADGVVSNADWITVIVSVLVALSAVWAIPQTPSWLARWGKAIFAGLIAAGAVLVTGWIDGDLGQAEIITAIIAFLLGSGLTGSVSDAATSDPVVDGRLVGVSGQAKEVLVKSRAHGLPPGRTTQA